MTIVPTLLLQNNTNGLVAGGILAFTSILFVVFLAVAVVFLVGMWKVFVKAGQPGWAVLIPIYNGYILVKIAGRPGWWLLLFLIPLVNLVVAAIVAIDLAKAFGQSAAFGVVLLFLLGGIGYLVLGFGNYRYLGPPARAAIATA